MVPEAAWERLPLYSAGGPRRQGWIDSEALPLDARAGGLRIPHSRKAVLGARWGKAGSVQSSDANPSCNPTPQGLGLTTSLAQTSRLACFGLKLHVR